MNQHTRQNLIIHLQYQTLTLHYETEIRFYVDGPVILNCGSMNFGEEQTLILQRKKMCKLIEMIAALTAAGGTAIFLWGFLSWTVYHFKLLDLHSASLVVSGGKNGDEIMKKFLTNNAPTSDRLEIRVA